MSFDELNKTDLGYNGFTDFEAGAQSRQAEIDGLQERIYEAIYNLQHIEYAMWKEQVEHVLMVLKGGYND